MDFGEKRLPEADCDSSRNDLVPTLFPDLRTLVCLRNEKDVEKQRQGPQDLPNSTQTDPRGSKSKPKSTTARNPGFVGSSALGFGFLPVPWFPGSLVPWFPGSLLPWFPGSLVPWCPGSLVPGFPGSLVPWFPSSLVPWFPRNGTQEPRNPGNPRPQEPTNRGTQGPRATETKARRTVRSD